MPTALLASPLPSASKAKPAPAYRSVNPFDGKVGKTFATLTNKQLEDSARGQRMASRIDTSMVFINNLSWSDAELPFGGIKKSGYGHELGDLGIQQFVNKKLVRTASMEAPV